MVCHRMQIKSCIENVDTILLSGAIAFWSYTNAAVALPSLCCDYLQNKMVPVLVGFFFVVLWNRKIPFAENLKREAAEVFCWGSSGYGKIGSLSGTAPSEMQWCLCKMGWFLFFHSLCSPPC